LSFLTTEDGFGDVCGINRAYLDLAMHTCHEVAYLEVITKSSDSCVTA